MNPPRIPLSEAATVEAVRSKLPAIAELLLGQVTQLGELRRALPLPDERTQEVVYESESGLVAFPALDLALDLETFEESLSQVASELEQKARGEALWKAKGKAQGRARWQPPEDERDDPLR